uniref:histidine kinase n=1 Tax=Desulfatirhabdium butyrativorans TaxID=340467 RepID=A0A7C4RSP9_9BACT
MLILIMSVGSILLQFVAALLALKLIPITGRRAAWILISAGLFLMAFRRLITFIHIVSENLVNSLLISAEGLAFTTSALMFFGILRIAPLFQSIKRSAEALRESEKKYRTIFDGSKDPIFFTTKEGRIIDINQAALDLFGYTRQEMIGLDIHHVYAQPENRANFQIKIEQDQAVKDYPLVFLKKDRTPIDCLVTASVRFNDDGLVEGYQGIIRDVSEHNRLVNQIKKERLKFFTLLENLPAFVDVRASDYSIVFANKRFKELFGDPANHPNHVLFHPDAVSLEPCRENANPGNPSPHEFEWTSSDGNTYTIYRYTYINADGSKRFLELGIDITSRKRAEAERMHLFAAIEQTMEGILIIDGDEKVLYTNPAFERIHRSLCTVGRSLESLERDYHDTSFKRGVQDCLKTGRLWHKHLLVRNAEGRTFEVEATVSPVRNERDKITSCVVIERDVTDVSRLEKQLRQAQKMEALGTLASGIAHDFNNILSIIFGYTDLALLTIPDEHHAKNHIENIRKTAWRAKELVDQILLFSRQGENPRHPVQIVAIVKETLGLLRASLPSSIEIVQAMESKNMILADPTQIRQVIMNLCTNAAHAMRDRGGTLELRVADVALDDDFVARYPDALYPGHYIKLSVSDTGHGMDPNTLKRIFDPYFTTKGPGEGTGLGLAVVHGIVKNHGGMITVYSEPGKGTSFHVFLPIFQNEDLPTEIYRHGITGVPPGGNERILFVDDEVSLADINKELLEALGYEVTIRTSSMEALEAFRAYSDRIDLVITDLTMPNMGGIDFAKALRQIRPDIPIILCTGFSEIAVQERLKQAGISRLLAKPLVLDNLANTVREVLDESKAKRNPSFQTSVHPMQCSWNEPETAEVRPMI